MLAIEVKLSARDDARRGDAGLFRSRRGGERRRSQEDAWCTGRVTRASDNDLRGR